MTGYQKPPAAANQPNGGFLKSGNEQTNEPLKSVQAAQSPMNVLLCRCGP
jgi:hypothetical protein